MSEKTLLEYLDNRRCVAPGIDRELRESLCGQKRKNGLCVLIHCGLLQEKEALK